MAISKKARIVIGAVVAVAVLATIGGVANAITGDPPSKSRESSSSAPALSDGTSAPVEENTAEPSPSVTVATDLAARVQTALLSELQVTHFSDLAASGSTSPLWGISSIEDVSGGTIRVFYQEALSKSDRALVARQVFSLSQPEAPDLRTVVIRDTSGIDSNHYR